MASTQTILVTGANRGIGFSIIQALAPRLSTATYILAIRYLSSAQTAISELRELGITSPLDIVELDITNDSTIIKARKYVEEKYGKLDGLFPLPSPLSPFPTKHWPREIVLINNAGTALLSPNPDGGGLEELRENFNTTFNANITSIAAITSSFLPLLHMSSAPKVINISSGRASLSLSSAGELPPTASVSYSVSKVGVNALTVEMQKGEDLLLKEREEGGGDGVGGGKTRFWAVNPGFCRTAFNGFRGTRDPVVGAEVVVRHVLDEEGVYGKGGFWQWDEGEEGGMRVVPW
jgi:NAD(P)-dependent dehydrogenase (short-subunit alcohol dehydrogenase family)